MTTVASLSVGLAGVQLVTAGPASAVAGLVKVTSPGTTANSVSPKTATATCPTGKRILGGGGWLIETGTATRKLILTQLRPVQGTGGQSDRYVVTGAEAAPGISGNWLVQAYALCADPVAGMRIVSTATASSSTAVQATSAVCPGGTRALGSGASITNPQAQVALQVARASGPGDIVRAQAREDADGYSGSWSVTAHAVCAPAPPGYEVVFGESPERGSEAEKVAFAGCPAGKRVHGAGAAVSNTAPAGVALNVIYPFNDLDEVEAFAVEGTPTSASWDFIVATAICAN